MSTLAVPSEEYAGVPFEYSKLPYHTTHTLGVPHTAMHCHALPASKVYPVSEYAVAGSTL